MKAPTNSKLQHTKELETRKLRGREERDSPESLCWDLVQIYFFLKSGKMHHSMQNAMDNKREQKHLQDKLAHWRQYGNWQKNSCKVPDLICYLWDSCGVFYSASCLCMDGVHRTPSFC